MDTLTDLVETFCSTIDSHVNERIRNALLGALSSSTSGSGAWAVAGPARRGPGRPRKDPLVEVRRGPGRPRKVPVEEARRGPGRPRKEPVSNPDGVGLWSAPEKKKRSSPAMKAHGRYVGLLNWARHQGLPSHLTAAAKLKATKGSKAASDFLASLREKAHAKTAEKEAKAQGKVAKKEAKAQGKAAKKAAKAQGKAAKKAAKKEAQGKTRIVVVDGAKASRKATKVAKIAAKAIKAAAKGKARKATKAKAKATNGLKTEALSPAPAGE